MNAYAEVSAALATALTDITAGGELQLLNQVIELKEELNGRIAASQRSLAARIQAKMDELSAMAPVSVSEPPCKVDKVQTLGERAQQLIQTRDALIAQREALKAQLSALNDEARKQQLSSQNEQQRLEYNCKLYHQITGVFWENEQAGYVLSEEIAKPIKFQEGKAATEQLWEMIDM